MLALVAMDAGDPRALSFGRIAAIRRPIASLAKVMTALAVIERGNLDVAEQEGDDTRRQGRVDQRHPLGDVAFRHCGGL